MARPRKYSTEEMIAALKRCRGMVYLAAEEVGCDADTIYLRAKSTPAIDALIRHERGKVIDVAEQKLWDGVQAGEQWAVQMALKTIGRDRGYVEKSEVEHSGVKRLIIEEQEYTGDDDGGGDRPADGPAAPRPTGVPPE